MKLRNKIKGFLLVVLLITQGIHASGQLSSYELSSPDKKMVVRITLNEKGQLHYTVTCSGKTILEPSRLGLVREDDDFSRGLSLLSTSPIRKVKDRYRMLNAKRRDCRYEASAGAVHLRSSKGEKMDVLFQVSNDGLAFRYSFPDRSAGMKKVLEENTGFHFDTAARAWLQPMQVAKTGWESTNPAYEEHYLQEIAAGTPAPTPAGWVYPALFQTQGTWVLITESSLDSNYCGTRLRSESPGGEYSIGFPDPREIMPGEGYLPKAELPFSTPWRIVSIGSLKTIVESTLGTDLAKPSVLKNPSFVKPGKASWSWIMSKDDSIVYSEQVRYIDLASQMNWQYCLVDVNWDRKIGYEKMKQLADYAASKKVGLLVWYNSSGSWNTTRYTPKSKLLTHEDRVAEFARLKSMGIKGAKIDFFAGDGQSVIKYYLDILNDAAAYGLLVNFHGATIPRGWHRTYPHLLTMEAVRGFEMVTFMQRDADAQANHCTVLPFTRNAFDPMDFTPMNLYRIPTNVRRKTTSAFELALPVIFLSGIQHYAESPAGMSQVPEYVKKFLRELPDHWEDTRFIEGFPGKYVILARKSGKKWYVAGINGENKERTVSLDLRSFKRSGALMITDGETNLSFAKLTSPASSAQKQMVLKPNGGFVMILE